MSRLEKLIKPLYVGLVGAALVSVGVAAGVGIMRYSDVRESPTTSVVEVVPSQDLPYSFDFDNGIVPVDPKGFDSESLIHKNSVRVFSDCESPYDLNMIGGSDVLSDEEAIDILSQLTYLNPTFVGERAFEVYDSLTHEKLPFTLGTYGGNCDNSYDNGGFIERDKVSFGMYKKVDGREVSDFSVYELRVLADEIKETLDDLNRESQPSNDDVYGGFRA